MSLVGRKVGNYQVTEKIGEGGMGSVYLGVHPTIGKKVAIKTLHAELAQKEDIVSRFFTEARAVNDIAHPNIVDIVDFGKMADPDAEAKVAQGQGTPPEVVYFVMEFLDGEGLNSRMKRDGLSARDTVHVMKQCCSALAASHKKGIIHRDLKPENIYLVTRGSDRNYVKLLDFGIAKLTGGGEGGVSQHKTRTGLVIGTPAYMSPEQCEGKGLIDVRSDIYSLGVVMYELLTGRVPFPGDGFGEVLVAHLTKTPELPSTLRADVPAGLEAIVMHAMEKDKNRRFQTMEEFLAAVEDPGAHLERYGSPSGRADGSAAGTMMFEQPVREKSGVVRIPSGQGASPLGRTGNTGSGQRPTTLSGASGEVAEGGARGSGGRLGVMALGLLAVGVAAGGIVYVAKGKPAVVEAAAVPEVKKAPEKVKVTIHSTPEGARLFRAGVADPIGVTPFAYDVQTNDPDFDILVKLDGYKDETRTVTTTRDHEMLVPLAKLEVAAPTPPPAPPAAVVTPPPAPAAHPAPRPHAAKPGKKGAGDKDDVMAPNFD